MARRLSERMLRRRVARWGYPYSKTKDVIVVVFEDGKMALVYPRRALYSSIRAWNPAVRDAWRAAARHRFNGTLADLLEHLKARG